MCFALPNSLRCACAKGDKIFFGFIQFALRIRCAALAPKGINPKFYSIRKLLYRLRAKGACGHEPPSAPQVLLAGRIRYPEHLKFKCSGLILLYRLRAKDLKPPRTLDIFIFLWCGLITDGELREVQTVSPSPLCFYYTTKNASHPSGK